MASFAGINMGERGNGGSTFPVWTKKMLVAVKLRPNGTPVMQEIGMDVERLAFVARVTAAELVALYDQVLESGSLVFGWETHDAFLESIEGVSEVVANKDTYFATLNFIRL